MTETEHPRSLISLGEIKRKMDGEVDRGACTDDENNIGAP